MLGNVSYEGHGLGHVTSVCRDAQRSKLSELRGYNISNMLSYSVVHNI